jgi:hypothetical protein
MVGCADVHAHESVRGSAAVRSSAFAPRDATVMRPASLRLAPPGLERERATPRAPAADPAEARPADEAPPDKTLALLSALGAIMLVIGRRLGRDA